jgi:hypothetical protein
MSKILDMILANEARDAKPETGHDLERILEMQLDEFEKGDYSIEVFSGVLGGTVWLCPDSEVAARIRRVDPEAVCYTAAELRHLTVLNPGPESLKSIHEGKRILNGSIVDCEAKP